MVCYVFFFSVMVSWNIKEHTTTETGLITIMAPPILHVAMLF